MTSTYELIIYGKVQHVGFRDRIENLGHALGIDGIIYNHKDGTVRILANFTSERKKQLFVEFIKELENEDNLIKIEKIEEKELETFIEFPEGINRISTDDLIELNKKLDEGVKYIKLIFGEMEKTNVKLDMHTELLTQMNNKFDKLDSKLGKLDDKLGKLDSKLDKIIEILEKIEKKL